MKRILLTALTILSLTTSCKSADTFNLYKDEMSELLRDPKTRTLKGGENDVNDLRGCPVLFKLWAWELDGRSWSWFDGSMISESGIALDMPPFSNVTNRGWKNLDMVKKSNHHHIVYIGPWQKITITKQTGFLAYLLDEDADWKDGLLKTSKEQKQIRFFAYTSIGGGEIQYQYESKTEENKDIPEKKFSLPTNAKIAPDKFGLCVTKWTAKYGYNAIAEVKSKNQFSRNYLVPTGKIIDSETGEIIADEKGNLINSK